MGPRLRPQPPGTRGRGQAPKQGNKQQVRKPVARIGASGYELAQPGPRIGLRGVRFASSIVYSGWRR
eukprot:6425103-Pyramimonas_sp.AAC.1